MTKEIWKNVTIENCEDYKVSSLGRVEGPQGKILRPRMDKYGYLTVCLQHRGQGQQFVHRLVALAFIENPAGKETVNHENGIRWDCRASNLSWMTHEENIQHAREELKGLKFPDWAGYAQPAHLTREQVVEIKVLLRDTKITQEAIAKRYGVTNTHISNIHLGKRWASVKI